MNIRVLRDFGKWDDIYSHIKLFESLDDAIKERNIMIKNDLRNIFYNDEKRNSKLGIENLLKEILIEHNGELEEQDAYNIYYDPDKMTYTYLDYNDDYESNMDIVELPIN